MHKIQDNLSMRCPVALLVLAIAAPAAAQDNLILNPGFEDVTNGQPDHWDLRDSYWDDIELSSENPSAGNNHIRTVGFQTDSVSNTAISQTVPGITERTHYLLTLEYNKGDFIVGPFKPPIPLDTYAPLCIFLIEWYDENQTRIETSVAGYFSTEDDLFNTYTTYESDSLVAPTGSVAAKINLAFYGGDEFWGIHSVLDVDNVSFTVVPTPSTAATLLLAGALVSRRKRH